MTFEIIKKKFKKKLVNHKRFITIVVIHIWASHKQKKSEKKERKEKIQKK